MRPKIGLALGAGGARGFAHIGVLRVLEKHAIPVDYIAGTSMGALVGALYCAGHDVNTLERMATIFRQKFYLDFTVPKMGFISGAKVKQLIHLLTKGKTIEELSPPIAIIATDLRHGEKVVFRKGKVADAVRASIGIPGIFVPEKMDGRLLVDGSVIDRVPVSVVKEMGADLIIAVDVSSLNTSPEIASIFDVIMQSIDIMQQEMVRYHEIQTDVIICPPLRTYSSGAFAHAAEIIRSGEHEAEKKITEIKEKIASWKESSPSE